MGISHGKEWHNAPIIIAQIIARLGVIGLLFTMVIIGRAVAKDFENNIHELIFSRPISKWQYLGGRFFGSFVANLLIFSGIILGLKLVSHFLVINIPGFQFGSYLLPIFLLLFQTCYSWEVYFLPWQHLPGK